MSTAETARTVIGTIGNVISFCLFVSPSPTFWRIIKKKDVEGFSPDPYLATVMNCLFWIFYALPIVHPGSILVVTTNGIGLAIELIYLAIFCVYCDRRQKMKVFIVIVGEIIFLGGIAAITMEGFHSHAKRSTFVGAFCVVFGVMMYASPLTIMVIQTKSVKYMPFWLSLASFLNGVTWVVYALIKFDLYITIANGLGAVLGFCQLVLYASFYHTTNWNDNDNNEVVTKPRSELKLSNGASRPHI